METFLLCAAIILFNDDLLHATAVPSYPVRLRGGSNVYEGQVEVLYCVNNSSCTWTPVCASNWDDNEIAVTCRQLGLHSDDAPTVNNSRDSNAIMMTCDSNAYGALGYCNINVTTSCESTDTVEVQCSSPPRSPSFNVTLFKTPTASISATIRWRISTDGQSGSATRLKHYEVRSSDDGYNPRTVNSSETTLHHLEPCALYTCCVAGIDTDGAIGEVNCTSFRTPTSIMDRAPTGLEYIELQSQSVTLQWEQLNTTEKCNPPILYSVQVEGHLCNEQQRNEFNTTNTHIIITGLCPHSSYSISVKACTELNTDECGAYSATLSVRTLEDVPTKVNNVVCRALSSTQVNIMWEPPTQTNGVIRFYEAILNNTNTTQTTAKYVDSDTTTTTLSHLHPNHHYWCSVAVYSAVGRNISAVQNVTLLQSSPTGVPEQFSCSPHSPISLQLDWRQPHPLERNGPIENYSVIVWNLDSNEVVYSNFTSYTSLTIHSLTSYHNYKCAVAANGQFGLGPFDDRQVWISQTNHSFGPPSNLQADNITSTSFRVTWSEPSVRYTASVHVDSYRIQVFDHQDNRTISGPTSTGSYYYEQRSLRPNYCYQIEVSAIVGGVQGPVASHSVQTVENTIPLKVGAIVYPILSVVFVAVMILLISANVRLVWRIQKMKKAYKVQGEVAQDRVSNGEVIENTLPLESISISTFSDSEKKVKPPAVPPKTYLESTAETESEIETPSDKEAQGDDSDIDNCSMGSDSLYDMKLEDSNFQFPERIASIASEPAHAIQRNIMIPPRNLPRIQAMDRDPAKSLKSVCIRKEERVNHDSKHSSDPREAIQREKIPPRNLPRIQAMARDHPPKSLKVACKTKEEEGLNHDSEHSSDPREADHDYRKLDPKMLSPPNRYEDHHDLSSKPRHDKTTKESSDTTGRHCQHATGQENQYEPLRLKTINKPSEYQEIGPKWKAH